MANKKLEEQAELAQQAIKEAVTALEVFVDEVDTSPERKKVTLESLIKKKMHEKENGKKDNSKEVVDFFIPSLEADITCTVLKEDVYDFMQSSKKNEGDTDTLERLGYGLAYFSITEPNLQDKDFIDSLNLGKNPEPKQILLEVMDEEEVASLISQIVGVYVNENKMVHMVKKQ